MVLDPVVYPRPGSPAPGSAGLHPGLRRAHTGPGSSRYTVRAPGPMRGHVIDFLMLPNWPVFNVADICINVAAGLILLLAFRGIRIDGGRSTTKSEPQPEPESDR